MDVLDYIFGSLSSGWYSLLDYVSQHTLTCLVPALFIAGAIAVFIKKEAILRFFGPDVPKWKSYPVASISGTILAVCSCTILPLFAGLYKKGSGIGPAIAFLYSGPAINVLAIVYTAGALGYGIGIARAVASISISVIIGLIMAAIFRKHDLELRKSTSVQPVLSMTEEGRPTPQWATAALFISLMGILLFGASPLIWLIKGPIVLVLIAVLILLMMRFFHKDQVRSWWIETWDLTKKIVPILIIGAFVVGIIAYIIPPESFRSFLGNEGIIANLIASIVGALLYMPTLLEVPIVGTTFGYSDGLIGSGPALSLLLAGPAVSLPSMIVLYRIVGARKTITYIALVIFLSALMGFIYGNLFA